MKFENWCSGELSTIGHHFSNKVIWKLMLSKNVNNKKCAWMNILILDIENWLWKSNFGTFWCNANSQNSIISFDYSWLLGKNLSNFVPPAWKLDNPYFHQVLQKGFQLHWNPASLIICLLFNDCKGCWLVLQEMCKNLCISNFHMVFQHQSANLAIIYSFFYLMKKTNTYTVRTPL